MDLDRLETIAQSVVDALERNRYLEQQNIDLQRALVDANQRIMLLVEKIAELASLKPAPLVTLSNCPPGFTMVATPGNPLDPH